MMDGNLAALERRERDNERFERSRPVCSNCHELITSEKCYETGDGLFCEKCADSYYAEQIELWKHEDERNTEEYADCYRG